MLNRFQLKSVSNFIDPVKLILFTLCSINFTSFSTYAKNKTDSPTIPISVQKIIDWSLRDSLQKKSIDLMYQKTKSNLLFSEAVWDPTLSINSGYEDSRAKLISGFNDNRDVTKNLTLSLNKKTHTGTLLGFDYNYIYRDSDLSSAFLALGMKPELYQNVGSFKIKQELWNNFFGTLDRKKNESAQFNYEKSILEHDELVEDFVVAAVQLYWQTYTAKENYKQNIAAKEKYQILYDKVSQKHKMGFDDKAELIKTKAELENEERNIQSSHVIYENLLSKLFNLIHQPVPFDVEFEVSEEIPPVPTAKLNVPISNLRKMQSAEKSLVAADLEKEVSESSTKPNLNLIAQTGAYGLDITQSDSQSQVSKWNNSKYYVGIEFSMKLDSSSNEGERVLKKIQYDEALNQKLKTEDDLKETLNTTQLNLNSKYSIALKAKEAVQLWESAIESQEKNHKFGRISTAELIMDYQSYFRSRGTYSASIADYNIALEEYLAARDEIIK